MNTNAKGATYERRSKKWLEGQDWLVTRAAGSLGDADLVALRLGDRPLLVESKSGSTSPYKNFGKADRQRLIEVAAAAGAQAVLHFWKPRAREPEVIWPDSWPS